MLKQLKSTVKKAILISTGRVNHLKKTVFPKNVEWYGNSYGGFFACPAYIDENSVVYSVGIGEDISFDRDMIERHGCRVYGFDPTPKSINWLKSLSDIPEKFTSYDYGLGDQSKTAEFFLPKNTEFVSGSFVSQNNVDENRRITVQLKSLADIAKEFGHQKIDVLKMDIEGAEYAVFDNLSSTRQLFIGQILVEFHERFFPDGKQRTTRAIAELKRHGFELFAISRTFEELSFINTALLKG